MIENITNEFTEHNNNQSDTSLGGMSLGNSQPIIDFDEEEEKNKPEQPIKEEKEFDAGLTEQQIINENMKIDEINDIIEHINQTWNTGKQFNTLNDIYRYILGNNIMNVKQLKEAAKNWNGTDKDFYINLLNKEAAKSRNKISNLKDNEKYDNRTDEQKREDEIRKKIWKREDNAYQRAADDLRKAGLNPAIISGGAAGAGGGGLGGGGSSKDEEEEKKRRRRKKEEEARRRAEQLRKEQQMMQMLQLFGNVASMFGTQYMRGKSWERYGAIRSGKIKYKGTTNKPAWLNEYLDELENMG